MTKMSKRDVKLHLKAMDLINSDKVLSEDDKLFIFDNYDESYSVANNMMGAFFTPMNFASDFSLEIPLIRNGKYVDLCAGIGKLSYYIIEKLKREGFDFEYTMVELSSSYSVVGRRLFPDVNWIHGNVFESFTLEKQFDVAISNPPFGNIKSSETKFLKYKNSNFELKLMEFAGIIASLGVFIIPQSSSSFSYSGKNYLQRDVNSKGLSFERITGHKMLPGVGIDTKFYLDDWNGVSPLCEVVTIDYDGLWY